MTENWEQIYRAARYAVFYDDREVSFEIGEKSEDLDRILAANRVRTFAFLTACNPQSARLGASENRERQARLAAILHSENLSFLIGYGTSRDESWEREESYFILEISVEDAVRLAQQFEQNAIVYGKLRSEPQLVWCGQPIV